MRKILNSQVGTKAAIAIILALFVLVTILRSR